jgi:radical SAM protein with 4Fe4S-binding SPASM domain
VTRCEELCIELTSLCNQDCVHCSSEATLSLAAANALPMERVETLLQWFRDQGGEFVEFSGGEPLLYSRIVDVVRMASALGLDVRLYSTGAPKQSGVPSLADLQAAGLSSIVFSLQGASRVTHEGITRTPGSFTRTIHEIQRAVGLGLRVGVHFVPMKPNFRELSEAVDLAASIGVDEFSVLRFVAQGRGAVDAGRLALSYEEFQILLKELADLVVDEKRIRVRAGCPMSFCALYRPEVEMKECRAGISTAIVDPVGLMSPCPAFKKLPGVRAADSVEDWASAWEQCQINGVGSVAAEGLQGPCAECLDVAVCQGRCAAQRHLSNGSLLLGPDPMCPVAGRDRAQTLSSVANCR